MKKLLGAALGVFLCLALAAGTPIAWAEDEIIDMENLIREHVDAPEFEAESAEHNAEKKPESKAKEPAKKKKSVRVNNVTIKDLEKGTLQERFTEMDIHAENYGYVEKLTISSGTIDSADFKHIRELKNLHTLIMAGAALDADRLPERALENMAQLREVELPAPSKNSQSRKRTRLIGDSAFRNCARLTKLTALQEVHTVGSHAFSGCKRIATLKFPALVTIGINAFYECTRLSTFEFTNVTEIGANAFENCTALKHLDLPKLQTLGSHAFVGCKEVTSIKLGKDAEEIGESAFSGLSALRTAQTAYVRFIGAKAFANCTKLESISLARCEMLGDEAFAGCRNLEKVTWPKNRPDTIGSACFKGCALDFSKGFPKGMNVSHTGAQKPRVYFTLSASKGTIFSDEEFEEPKVLMRTQRGTTFSKILGEDWVDDSVSLPKVARSPKRLDTTEPGKLTIKYTLTKNAFADTTARSFVLTIVDAPLPTPLPLKLRSTEASTIPEDDIEPFTSSSEAKSGIWASLSGLSFAEMTTITERDLNASAQKNQIAEFTSQRAYPIDLDEIALDEPIRIPLIVRNYLTGHLVITLHEDDLDTSENEEGLTFSLEALEGAKLVKSTLQIVSDPAQIDPYLAQHPDEAYAGKHLQSASDASEISSVLMAAAAAVESPVDKTKTAHFYAFDEPLNVRGISLLYVNAFIQFQPSQMPLYVVDTEARTALSDIMQHWNPNAEG